MPKRAPYCSEASREENPVSQWLMEWQSCWMSHPGILTKRCASVAGIMVGKLASCQRENKGVARARAQMVSPTEGGNKGQIQMGQRTL